MDLRLTILFIYLIMYHKQWITIFEATKLPDMLTLVSNIQYKTDILKQQTTIYPDVYFVFIVTP